jgi:protein SCO1/2
MTQPFYRWLPAFGLVLVGLGSYLAWAGLGAGRAPTLPAERALLSATAINDDLPLPAFVAARDGGRFGNEHLRGRWSLLFFGYTHCADVCPAALALLKDVRARLAARNLPLPQVVLLSADPARDTPALLKQYVSGFDPSFIGATAADDALAPLVKHLGARYARHDRGKAGDYAVDHTAAIYLIDPQGRLLALFSPPQEAARMAADYAALTR